MLEHLVARVAGMRYNHPRQHALVVEIVARSFALAFNRVQLSKQIKKKGHAVPMQTTPPAQVLVATRAKKRRHMSSPPEMAMALQLFVSRRARNAVVTVP